MKKLVLGSVMLLALGGSTAVMAAGLSQNAQQNTHGGLYVGGGLGYSSNDLPDSLFSQYNFIRPLFTANNLGNSSANHFTGNAHLGYLFPVTQKFLVGAEVGYNYLPSTTYNYNLQVIDRSLDPFNQGKVKVSSYSIDFLGVAKYYITDKFSIIGKAGGSYTRQTTEVNYASLVNNAATLDSQKVTKGEVLPKVAVGFGYNILPNVELTAEYSHTFGDKVNQISDATLLDDSGNQQNIIAGNKTPSNNTVLVGVNYIFNM